MSQEAQDFLTSIRLEAGSSPLQSHSSLLPSFTALSLFAHGRQVLHESFLTETSLQPSVIISILHK